MSILTGKESAPRQAPQPKPGNALEQVQQELELWRSQALKAAAALDAECEAHRATQTLLAEERGSRQALGEQLVAAQEARASVEGELAMRLAENGQARIDALTAEVDATYARERIAQSEAAAARAAQAHAEGALAAVHSEADAARKVPIVVNAPARPQPKRIDITVLERDADGKAKSLSVKTS